jgi:hypothetical protein
VKLVVNNLGRITKAEIDVRPLTVFVGPNNTNKTWTAYAFYRLTGFLSRLTFRYFIDPGVEEDSHLRTTIEEAVEDIFRILSEASSDGIRSTVMYRAELIKNQPPLTTFSLAPQMLGRTLGIPDSEAIASGTKAELIVSRSELEKSIFESVEISYDRTSGKIAYKLISTEKGEIKDFSRIGTLPPSIFEGQADKRLKEVIREAVRRLVLVLIESTVVFPAERKSLQLPRPAYSYGVFEDASSPLALGFSAETSPLLDHAHMLLHAERMFAQRLRQPEPTGHYDRLAELLENRILQGNLSFKYSGADGNGNSRREGVELPDALTLQVKDGLELNMQASASVVRSLAGLDLYLKYICRTGSVLVIDEPEMNAHPDAQLMIAELLAMLANSGVTVVITTHSPYVVDHINNLIEASQLADDQQTEISTSFRLGSKSAFLKTESVSVYHFTEEGKVIDIVNRAERLLDLSTFSEASNYVANLYARILERKRDEPGDTPKSFGHGV